MKMHSSTSSVPRRKRIGLTMIEMLVVCGLFSVIGVVILQLYQAAYTEFEKASGEMTMSRHARNLSDKLIPLLSTATPVRNSSTECFYHPDPAHDTDAAGAPAEIYQCDFYSTECFLPDNNPAAGGPTTPPSAYNATSLGDIAITKGSAGTYASSVGKQWFEPVFERWIWELAPGSKSDPVRRSTSLYRYRLAWTPVNADGFRARSVYLERLDLQLDSGAADNGSTNGVTSGTVYPAARCAKRLLEKDISMLSFQRQQGTNIIQVRERVYNIDDQGRTMDGELMRDHRRQRRQRNYDIVTTIMVPNQTLGRN